jgi:hypothetical protein
MRKILNLSLALSLTASTWALAAVQEDGETNKGGPLAQGDAIIEVSDLSNSAKAYLKDVRNTAAMYCRSAVRSPASTAASTPPTTGDDTQSTEDSCPVYKKFYVDTIKYVIKQEQKAGKELKSPTNFTLLNGMTESGEAAEPITVSCQQNSGASGSAGTNSQGGTNTNQQSQAGANMDVIAVGFDVSSCDNVQNNQSSLNIDSKDKKQCLFYYTCAKPLSSYHSAEVAEPNTPPPSSGTAIIPTQVPPT